MFGTGENINGFVGIDAIGQMYPSNYNDDFKADKSDFDIMEIWRPFWNTKNLLNFSNMAYRKLVWEREQEVYILTVPYKNEKIEIQYNKEQLIDIYKQCQNLLEINIDT